MQQALPLSDRVRAALSDPTTSAALKALIEATGFELETTRQRLQAAKARAVDPMSSDAEAAEARRQHHDLGFEEERQTSSVARLKHRLATVVEDEDQVARHEQYDAAVKARDKAAETLRTVYPRAVAEIRDALLMLDDVEAKVAAANQRKPNGAEHIMGAESKALGQPVGLASGPHALALEVRLPARFGSGVWPVG
jgi:hypothetical protein